MKQFINQLQAGQVIDDTTFSLVDIKQHKDKNGNPYFRLILSDKSGEIKCNIWGDNLINCDTKALVKGSVVSVGAVVEVYQEKMQLNILNLKELKNGSYDLSDLLQMSRFEIDELWELLMKYVNAIKDKEIKSLLIEILKDKDIVREYRSVSAGIGVHHDFVGGLLEHVVEMLDIASSFKKWYPEVNYDIVYAGIILHDIGKTKEVITAGTTFDKSTRGKLIGHIALGVELVLKYLPKDFDEDKWNQIEHIILSHHMLPEYGAVVVPSTIEASIVSVVDKASSMVRIFQMTISKHSSDNQFTDYSKYANTSIYIPSKEVLEKVNKQYSLADFEEDEYVDKDNTKLI